MKEKKTFYTQGTRNNLRNRISIALGSGEAGETGEAGEIGAYHLGPKTCGPQNSVQI